MLKSERGELLRVAVEGAKKGQFSLELPALVRRVAVVTNRTNLTRRAIRVTLKERPQGASVSQD